MRVYISGKITGTDDFMERFRVVEERLEAEGMSVINPARVNACMPKDTTYEEYMKVSFCLLDMGEAIYMMNGWETSCGANREYGYALAQDKIVMFEEYDTGVTLPVYQPARKESEEREKPPCAIGDTVYDLFLGDDDRYHILPMKVCDISVYGSLRNGKVWNVYLEDDHTKVYRRFDDFGRTVFLTRKEAESKKAEKENE